MLDSTSSSVPLLCWLGRSAPAQRCPDGASSPGHLPQGARLGAVHGRGGVLAQQELARGRLHAVGSLRPEERQLH